MSRYARHLFICVNRRPEGHPKGCCAEKNSEALRDLFKIELGKRGLKGTVRANASGCLDACAHGPTVCIYPEGIWYGRVTPEDVPEIVERTVLRGEVIQRLLIPDARYLPEALLYHPLPIPGLPPHE